LGNSGEWPTFTKLPKSAARTHSMSDGRGAHSASYFYGGAALLERLARNIWLADRVGGSPPRVLRQDFTAEVLRETRTAAQRALRKKTG
jgi:hypothetical protein